MPGGPSWRKAAGQPGEGRPGHAARDHAAAPPARAAPALRTVAARLGRPHLSGGPARHLRRIHCPAASRSRFAADLLTILSRERKARNCGVTVIGAWNAQTQILGAFI